MINLEGEDLYFPNTKVIRDLLESLNYVVIPLDNRIRRKVSDYRAVCFSDWVEQFERIKQANKMYYCMDATTLTEDQSIFVFDILHVCPDYETFKEALEQYINSNP